MFEEAFETLGIAPTDDGRAIRAAFLRLARIYHPDRFVGMPEDVRSEAERRMKDASVAYEALRDVTKVERIAAPKGISKEELHERAEHYRRAMEERQAAEARDRERWRRWEEAERLARERMALEAEIEAMIRGKSAGPDTTQEPEVLEEEAKPASKPPSEFAQRLDSARRGEKSPLVPRKKD
ncbi:MAG: J domain-containing protein [Actinomycetota bacterium]